jgi:outer membrane murein-binding lipoprotein Lpp
MMKLRNILLSGVAVVSFSGCASDCTEEELQEKLLKITSKVQELATSGDVAKLMDFSNKANEISQAMKGSKDDLQAACQAADELLVEL